MSSAAFTLLLLPLAAAMIGARTAPGADWPMWRGNAARTGVSRESLPERLHLQWMREYPPLKPAFWQARQERLQFDLGYEPVVLGRWLFVASSRNDSVTALDAATGAERWRFYADGPVRLAPVAWGDQVAFGSDDGWLYCLAAETGDLRWKVRGAPSPRKTLGNDRLISVWPVRGGPVIDGGQLFFAAGVWPFEGIFVHALDARSGRSIWINDRLGSMYAEHPHGAMSFGGPSPQGYLLVHRGRLVLPSSRAFPAFLDRHSGELLEFEFGHGGHGSRPGSWFVAGTPEGPLAVDPTLNTEIHDAGEQTVGQRGARREPGEVLPASIGVGQESYRIQAGVRSTLWAGDREFRFDEGFPGVSGTVHSMAVAGGRLFVTTRAGRIYCFSGDPVEPRQYPLRVQPLEGSPDADAAGSPARALLEAAPQREGYALVWGLAAGRLAEELAGMDAWRVMVVDRAPERVDAFRRRLDLAGLYGHRIAAHAADPLDFGWPPYLASLIVCEDLAAAGMALEAASVARAFEVLRPYGGMLCLKLTDVQHAALAAFLRSEPKLAGAQLRRELGVSLVVRAGPLPGAADYAGEPNFDERVRFPLGLLWFGDTFQHHKLFYEGVSPDSGRGWPPYLKVSEGVMTYRVPEPIGVSPAQLPYAEFLRKLNARPHADAFTDIYTGRVLSRAPSAGGTTAPAPASVSRAPERRASLARRNPITGAEEARDYVKNHGCDLAGVDYGHLITMRSGTAAFYDKRMESGTINISGLRSGCRNTIVPAGGVLTLPAWTGNCSCNYPVFTSMAMVSMPEDFEQWSAWGGLAETGPIQRVGINFGAPGDRMTADGTLWLEWPRRGGPSPDVRVTVAPTNVPAFYRHALRMEGGRGWPWVFASGIQGMRSVRIDALAHAAPSAGGFSARWTGFVQTERSETNTFHARSDGLVRLWVDGFPVIDSTRYKPGLAPAELTGRLFLEAGRLHTLHAEYAHAAGSGSNSAFIQLSWSSPSRPKAILPARALATPDGQAGGVAGVYFANGRASGPGRVQVDPQIEFAWGQQRPPALQPRAIPALRERAFTVRLVFAEPETLRAGERVFGVSLQGRPVLSGFDIVKEAGGPNRGVVREFAHVGVAEGLEIEFVPGTSKPPVLCGVELAAE